jgi:hypothetical protein
MGEKDSSTSGTRKKPQVYMCKKKKKRGCIPTSYYIRNLKMGQ